ncbi:uncharacterized protein BX663DRAFT_441420 [Cokeromyces recurvatus]|uniref:uncharacterized protein n=1 Tax=Cokeromyces recurvatus TaxID=90255 RepID=UPI00221F9217|nr:uncharacterized protein BX663DRAFT_441420 [Cokeromyces recurvatus]KAI7899366.1 hypothetical protein BX663DRAFT_441420 [Cokeromyces recurvatus]
MTAKESACPHLGDPSDLTIEVKRVLYRNNKNEDDKAMCDLCHLDHAVYLNMHHDTHIEACLSCLKNNTENNDNYYPIQLELETGDLYCFKCGDPRKLMIEEDGPKVKSIVEYINAPESEEDLDKRRKAEHQLYVQELRREDMSLKFYLVEKQWGRTWMLFRTREGSPLPTKITNQKLARANGTLDPNIRLPMDKYRPSPETHGDIVSEKLWGYLSKVYGVQGRAYSEDDIIAPEYARLRVYVDDFKKSIYLYP